jgi:hypothetical protein
MWGPVRARLSLTKFRNPSRFVRGTTRSGLVPVIRVRTWESARLPHQADAPARGQSSSSRTSAHRPEPPYLQGVAQQLPKPSIPCWVHSRPTSHSTPHSSPPSNVLRRFWPLRLPTPSASASPAMAAPAHPSGPIEITRPSPAGPSLCSQLLAQLPPRTTPTAPPLMHQWRYLVGRNLPGLTPHWRVVGDGHSRRHTHRTSCGTYIKYSRLYSA